MHWVIVGILIWIGLTVAPLVIGIGVAILGFVFTVVVPLAIAAAIGAWLGAPDSKGIGAFSAVCIALVIWWVVKAYREDAIAKTDGSYTRWDAWQREQAAEAAAYREQFDAGETKRQAEAAAYREQFRPGPRLS